MKNLEGIKWGELTEEQQNDLLSNANCVDSTGDDSKGGNCIVDLTSKLSVPGKLIVGNDEDFISICDDAIIYKSAVWEDGEDW